MKLNGVGHIQLGKPITKKEYDMKIAVFRRGGLGDGLIESAVIGALRRHFPNSHITAYSDTTFLQVFSKNNNCNVVVPVEWKRGLITEVDVRNHYMSMHDLWFDVKPLQNLEGRRSGDFIAPAIKNKLSDIESRYYFFNGPELVSFYEEIKARGQIESFSKLFNIDISMSDAYLIEEEPDFNLPTQYATISAGWTETSFYKAWNQDKWEEICKNLNKNGICPIQIGKSTENMISGAMNVTHLSIYQQYSVVKNAMFHMGSDGFFSHVSAKYNKPTIILWGVTPWQVWGHKYQYDVISPKYECLWWTYYNWAHESRCPEIMNAITVDMVSEKIDLLLEENKC